MAQQVEGRRAIVQDPLRQQAQQARPERSVQLQGVRGPAMPSMAGFGAQQAELQKALGGLDDVLTEMFDEQKDTWITEGKTAFMSGVTEQELMKNGNRYTQMGYLQLKARNDVNNWYMQESADLIDKSRSMAPEEYQKYLGEKRAAFLETISDPYAKKVAVAAFEQVNPDLAAKQFTQNNNYNMEQRETEVAQFLDTGSISSPSRGVVVPGETSLKVSPQPVEPVMQLSVMDRDLGIKTLIGEAGNQGEYGMAAVAHVIRNRATDSRYPSSIAGVVRQKNQFSVWNKGKEGRASQLNALKPGNPIYDKAAKVFDTVMSGRHVDPTGGALFYHSPSGMKAYAQQGVQVSQATRNRLAAAEASPGTIKIGAHMFYGRTDGKGRAPRDLVEPIEQGDTGGETKYVDPMVKVEPRNTEGTAAGNTIDQLNEQAQTNEGVAGVKEAGAPNEVLDFIRNYKGLPRDRMAKQVAASMSRQLDAGNDQLFSDAGGLSILYELGADAADLDKVARARQRYETKKDNEFDEADLKFEDDILRQADAPDADRDSIMKMVDERVKSGQYTDQQGKSLARAAAAQIRQNLGRKQAMADAETKKQQEAANSVFSNDEFMQEIGGLYQQIQAGTVDFPTAQENVRFIADHYGAKPDEVEKLLGKVFELDQSRQTALRNKAEAALASTASSNANKAEADQALARGFGLSNATGEVKVVDGSGNTVKMTAQEYGIQKIKQEALLKNGNNVAAVANEVFTKLQQHDVVDQQTRAQMTAAITGPIIDPKTKEVNKDAQEAYDLYTSLRTNPQINDGYLARVVGDTYTRNVLELAYTLDAGNLTGPQALVRAKEMLDNKDIDPNARIGRDAAFQTQAQTMATQLSRELATPGFFDRIGGYDQGMVDRALKYDMPKVQQKLMAAADAYHVQYPHQEPKASLELAKQDLKRDMKLVAGNILVTPDALHEKMGLTTPSSVNNAVTDYVKKFGADLFYNGDVDAYLKDSIKGYDPDYKGERSLPVKVTWMPNIGPNGSFGLFPMDGKTGAVNAAKVQYVPAERIGNWYKQEEAQPNMFQRLFDGARHGIAGVQRTNDQNARAAEIGAQMGAQFNQQ